MCAHLSRTPGLISPDALGERNMDAAFGKRNTMCHLLILLTVCVLEVLGLNNLARNKETFHSWNTNQDVTNVKAKTVVDGIMKTDFQSCTQLEPHDINGTLWQGYSWLLIRIGGTRTLIDLITLTVNMSSLHTDMDVASVFVGNDSSNSSAFVMCGTATVKSTHISTMLIRCRFPLRGRSVGVRVKKSVRSLYLCEVQVFNTADDDLNIALGMKSGPSDSTSGNSADRAVDGNKNTRLLDGSCFQSIRKGNPFWFVDLGSLYRITKVRITTSAESTDDGIDHNSIIYVTNAKKDHPPIYNNAEQCNKTGLIAYGGSKDVLCTKSVVGRFVYIQAYGNAQQSLSLCEVEVYGGKVMQNDKNTTIKVVASKTTVSPNTEDTNMTATSGAGEQDTVSVRPGLGKSTIEPSNDLDIVLISVISVLGVLVGVTTIILIAVYTVTRREKGKLTNAGTKHRDESENRDNSLVEVIQPDYWSTQRVGHGPNWSLSTGYNPMSEGQQAERYATVDKDKTNKVLSEANGDDQDTVELYAIPDKAKKKKKQKGKGAIDYSDTDNADGKRPEDGPDDSETAYYNIDPKKPIFPAGAGNGRNIYANM